MGEKTTSRRNVLRAGVWTAPVITAVAAAPAFAAYTPTITYTAFISGGNVTFLFVRKNGTSVPGVSITVETTGAMLLGYLPSDSDLNGYFGGSWSHVDTPNNPNGPGTRVWTNSGNVTKDETYTVPVTSFGLVRPSTTRVTTKVGGVVVGSYMVTVTGAGNVSIA